MMENSSAVKNPYLNKDNPDETNFNREMNFSGNPGLNPVNFSLTSESGKNIFHYLKNINLINEPDLLILPPNNHYFYDENELKSIKTLINLKKLNLIEDLDTFLYTLFRILPSNVNFIGCFTDARFLKGNGFLSGLSTRFINLLDSKTVHNLDKKNVTELLAKTGFKVVDMAEMNELTFFYSQNVLQPVKSRTQLKN